AYEESVGDDCEAHANEGTEDQPEPDQQKQGDNFDPTRLFMTYLQFSDLARKQRENQHEIVKGWIPSGQLGLISGVGKLGKSTALFDMMVGLATGQPWMGTIETVQCPVYLLDIENPPKDSDDAIQEMASMRGMNED